MVEALSHLGAERAMGPLGLRYLHISKQKTPRSIRENRAFGYAPSIYNQGAIDFLVNILRMGT